MQICKIEQQQSIVIGMAEDDLEYALLRFIQIEQTREQQWPHFGHCGADRVALLAIQIPEDDRVIGIGIIIHAQLFRAFFQLVRMFKRRRTGHADARQIAFHIGDENGDTIGRKALCQPLQRHRFTRAGRACD